MMLGPVARSERRRGYRGSMNACQRCRVPERVLGSSHGSASRPTRRPGPKSPERSGQFGLVSGHIRVQTIPLTCRNRDRLLGSFGVPRTRVQERWLSISGVLLAEALRSTPASSGRRRARMNMRTGERCSPEVMGSSIPAADSPEENLKGPRPRCWSIPVHGRPKSRRAHRVPHG